ncbi:MAG TPA: serine/threonine-protein kinase [Pyrinomonadaceae bacterium]|nr:serine/threonine-protein kinase [Pyrinomonadaceae bacterium]
MPQSEWHKVEELFQAALDVPTGQRRAWLVERCGEDAELCGEVESLLAAEKASAGFLPRANLARAASALLADAGRERAVERIGRYKILREVGRGGMGVVYLAERESGEFSQRVAVKLVKRGLDTEDILRRFRNERQILASLHHPNIAQLFDGGETEDGRPYFVMEYVEGLPLLRYCEERGLSIAERLKMFRRVCAAVSHAHQNLVVHRDIKPSNILVTEDGEPKLLDFGVAKILNAGVAGETQTRAQQRVMTPEYASPEQVRGQHVTTATDVYSLGVVLFELLTSARPYKLKDTSPEELSRVICDSEPTRPSEAIADLKNRVLNPQSATRNPKLLRGDLDNIVLMALRKEPSRRYGSVEQLSEDIRRHLEGRPVLARKDTSLYRASKFVRRNRVGVAAACLVFLTLSAGIAATAWQARRAREQARIAEARSAEAKAALARTEKIDRFMQSIFSYANPDWFGRAGGRRDVSVLEAMRDIEKHIDDDFRDEPDVRADIYQQMGDSYRTQELYADAERNLRKALQLRLELYGEDSSKVAESFYILSGVRFMQGDHAEHERLLTKALEIQRRHPEEGNNLPYMMVDYASILTADKNDYAGALALDREALEEFRRRYGEGHHMVGEVQLILSRDYGNLGDYQQAEAFAAGYLQRNPSSKSYVLPRLVSIEVAKGDYGAAEDLTKQMLAQGHELKPEEITMMEDAQFILAYAQSDYAQAKAHAEKALAAQADLPASVLPTAYRARSLALALNRLGESKRAEALLRGEIERLKESEQVFILAELESALGEVLTTEGRFAEAEPLLRRAYETQQARVLPGQYDLDETRRRIAELHRVRGN